MRRLLLVVALAVPFAGGAACASFKNRRTPSGDFCSDMPVVPAGQEPGSEYHRLQPIASDPKARTEAERLESLRKAACEVGGDAVIEAVNEEVRAENATYATVSSGTAIIWLRRPNQTDPTPLKLPNKRGTPGADASGSPTSDAPSDVPSSTPTTVPSGVASAAPTVTPTAAPTSAPTAPASAKSAKPVAPPPKPPPKKK